MKYIIGILGMVIYALMLYIYVVERDGNVLWALGFWWAGYLTMLLVGVAQDFEE